MMPFTTTKPINPVPETRLAVAIRLEADPDDKIFTTLLSVSFLAAAFGPTT